MWLPTTNSHQPSDAVLDFTDIVCLRCSSIPSMFTLVSLKHQSSNSVVIHDIKNFA